MVKLRMLAAAMCATLALPVLANGFGEDRPYQFENSFDKQYKLNAAIAREAHKAGVHGTTYISNTSIGNQVIIGDGSSMSGTIGQNNQNSQQNAVGASLDDGGTVNVGAVIGGGG